MLAFTGIFTFLVSVTNQPNQETPGKDISKRKSPRTPLDLATCRPGPERVDWMKCELLC